MIQIIQCLRHKPRKAEAGVVEPMALPQFGPGAGLKPALGLGHRILGLFGLEFRILGFGFWALGLGFWF